MLPKTILAVLILAFVLTANAALDLTPTEHTFVGHGVPYRQLLFRDGKKSISMELPAGWSFRGGATRLQLTPPDKNFAEAVIEVAALPAAQPLDEAATQKIEQQVLSTVPPGSQNVIVIERNRNAVVIGGNESFEVFLTFQTLGQTFCRSTVVVNCPEMLLTFRFTAPKSEFAALNKTFRRSIASWQPSQPAPFASVQGGPQMAPQ